MLGHMAFDFDCWPAGRMVTPTLAGTRPGGAIAAAWAVMNFLGAEGYREKHAAVLRARRAIAKGVASLGFEVVGTRCWAFWRLRTPMRTCSVCIVPYIKKGGSPVPALSRPHYIDALADSCKCH